MSSAWSLISIAANVCQTLGYHLARSGSRADEATQATETRLFWTVYRMEEGLSLRLGRSSNIRDSDVTVSFDPQGERYSRFGQIQSKVWDHLYSPASLAHSDGSTRTQQAEQLANELRALMDSTRFEYNVGSHPDLQRLGC